MDKIYKIQGFIHEKLIVLPGSVLEQCENNPLVSDLFITDIGYFPLAKNHHRLREKGCENHILILCVDGMGIVKLDEEVFTLTKHTYIIIPQNTPHEYYADSKHPWSIYWIHFNGALSKEYIALLQLTVPQVHSINQHELTWFLEYFNLIYVLLENGYSIKALILTASLFKTLLSGLSAPSLFTPHAQHPFIEQSPVNQCISYMKRNINAILSLKTLTEEIHLSKSHLTDKFKEETGYTPIDYFIRLKIQRACTLLDTTEMNIQEVAADIGYSDPYYFSRVFKRIMSIPPLQYRNKLKG